MILPQTRSLSPCLFLQEAKPFSGVMIVNALTGEHEYLLDPDGTDLVRMAGITYRDGKLVMGSLKDDYIAEYTL